MASARFRLVFHVPPSAAAACKAAIFAAGAGRQGNYSECCFTAAGTGQFRPTAGANPAIGQVGALEEVEEVVVETLCVGEDTTKKAVAALKSAHPYEEPSYSVYKLEDF
ncbi:putative structural toxin protein [Rosellinia necatrix]|uniref:ATP phosphoribosyltransferase n=1 Tax=Rosellinia necatrix TaxID=77044 RepID=A0A1W2TB92_ROSNE|nr:putative structural toxin protein [Rosellinia necatrix]